MLNRNLGTVFAILWFFQNQPSDGFWFERSILKTVYFMFYVHSFPIAYTRVLTVPQEVIAQIIVVWYIIVMKKLSENLFTVLQSL